MTPRVHRVRSVKPECHYVSARGCVAAGFRSASQASCEDEAMTVLSIPLFAFFTVLTVLVLVAGLRRLGAGTGVPPRRRMSGDRTRSSSAVHEPYTWCSASR